MRQAILAFQCLTGLSMGLGLGVKFVGLFAVAMIGVTTAIELWKLMDWKQGLSHRAVLNHWKARIACLIFLPIVVFIIPYAVHFLVANRSGPGDDFMTIEFQASLKDSPVLHVSKPIYYGSMVTIKSGVEDVFLHSHEHNYPRHHLDGKVSSAGQQVTGYSTENDPNNDWVI